MKLTYRGISYQPGTSDKHETLPSPIAGQYRGVAFRLYPSVVASAQRYGLKYRGVDY